MRVALWILLLVLLVVGPCAEGKTRAQLRADAKERSGERGGSGVADTTWNAWLNMAQQSVATLSGLVEKEHADTFAGVYRLSLPTDVRRIKRVKVQVDSRWYDLAAYADSGSLPYDLTRDGDSVSLFLDDNGYVPTYVDFVLSEDSLVYHLPAAFRRPLGVVHRSSGGWQAIPQNPLFARDTNTASYFVAWQDAGAAELYVQGGAWIPEGDTLRLFYLRGLGSGDSLRVVYAGVPAVLSADSTECELPDNDEVLVIDEALRYYEQELKHYDVAASLWQQIRMDMGFTVKQ